MKLRLAFFLITLLSITALSAQRLSEAVARDFAADFLRIPTARGAGNAVQCAATLPAGYVFTTPDAFVVVGGNDVTPIALGYGTSAEEGAPLPPALATLLHSAKPRAPQDELFLQPGAPAGPLLPMVRHQKAPYNAACPYYTYDDGTVSDERCVVGCVATALEEILTYYQREIVLQDTLHGWKTDHYEIADVLPGTRVDTRLILNDYDTEVATPEAIDAVARLSLYCGMAAQMNWGLEESGTSVYRLVEPLKRAFGCGFVHYADSYKYAPAEWVKMIAREVRAERPVLYAGYTQFIEGHAFVIDGVDAEGLFHVNWGYGGCYDGYFRLDVLAFYEDYEGKRDTQAAQGFFCNQEALLLHPDAITPELPDTLSRTGLEVAVDSIYPLEPPRTGMFTPVAVCVRNTSDATLTTPFELFTNTPTDTLLFEQGTYIALTGVTLSPGEARTLVVDAQFSGTGNHLLRISPDDIQVLATTEVEILPYVRPLLSYTVSAPAFPTPDAVQFTVTAQNSSAAQGRAGVLQQVFLDEGSVCRNYTGAYQQSHVLYLNPGAERTDTITFRNLKPATTYTFKVTYKWTPVHEVTFTTPSTDGITPPSEALRDETWYSLDGRRLNGRPTQRGIYVRGGKKQVIAGKDNW